MRALASNESIDIFIEKSPAVRDCAKIHFLVIPTRSGGIPIVSRIYGDTHKPLKRIGIPPLGPVRGRLKTRCSSE